MASHRTRKLSPADAWLSAGVIIAGVALVPLTFAILFLTVNTLLRPVFGEWAWAVPVITEVGFVGLFLTDLLLERRRRPLAWLRIAPWLLAAVSMYLNVAAARGSATGIAGHGVVVLVFFGYLLAAKAAVKRLAEDDDEAERKAELAAACRYARDLLRDRKGPLWRFRPSVPSLLRRQVLTGRLGAEVMAALSEQSQWEAALRRFVVAGLTAGAWMDAEEKQARRVIERTVAVPDDASDAAPRKPVVKRTARASGGPSPTALAERAWRENPRLWRKDITSQFGISESSADRIQAKLGREGVVVGRGLQAVGSG